MISLADWQKLIYGGIIEVLPHGYTLELTYTTSLSVLYSKKQPCRILTANRS